MITPIFPAILRRASTLILAGLALGHPTLRAAPAAAGSRVSNFSVRANVSAGGDVLIGGFVVGGDAAKSLLVRGVGPTLTLFGVTGVLVDPVLSLYSGPTLQAFNDDWIAADNALQLATTATSTGAFALRVDAGDAALLSSLSAGNYTAIVSGKGAASGVALLEIYDVTNTGLSNFSARGHAGTGAATLIAGFVVDGNTPKPLLIRGVGPTLASLGVTGAIADPQLTLFRQGVATPLAQNDNWGGGAMLKTAFASAGAFSLTDASKDAALIANLDPGDYSVALTGVGTSAGTGLIELYDITPAATVAPNIVIQPASLTVVNGANASLTVIASSLTPLSYQWQKDGVAIGGATSDTLTLTGVQAALTGAYTVAISNRTGAVTSAPATIALAAPPGPLPPANTFDLVGFATKGTGTTGGGLLPPSDPNYHVLDASIANKAQQLRTWLESTTPLIVDVQVEVDLGALNNVTNRPKTNPELITSGLGVINVRSNKTVFSSTGATIRHGTFNVSGQNNIIIRNLRFRGLWEFDEGSQDPPNNAPWGYKIQDWDYIDIQSNAKNVWVDHCDFEKSYDGLADTKSGADLITYSWCRLGGDTEGAVPRQIAYLEKLYQGAITDSRVTFTFYKGLRDGVYASQGIPRQSVQDIIEHEMPHDKCNLVGSADTETVDIGALDMTFHHIYYHGCRQRLPRMRFGNAHVFDIFVDNSQITEGTNMATATTCDAAVFAENNFYLEVTDPFPPVSGTSPPGTIAQAGCRWIYQGVEQSLATNTFLKNPATWTWNTGTKNFTWAAAPAPNARALPYSYVADPADYVKNNLAYVGVIVPATVADQATLAGYLSKTAH